MGLDIREIVTRKIIEGLEKGELPWHKPWKDGYAVNHKTGKAYRGLNQLTLTYTAMAEGFVNRWVSMGIIRDNGWRIGKGQSPTYIAFFKWIPVDKSDPDGDKFPMLRYYKVWSISQIEGEGIVIPEETTEFEPLERAEQVIQGMPNAPDLRIGGNRAFYNWDRDFVQTPVKELFEDRNRYYSTMFHELGHSTGHEKRLGRKIDNDFGTEEYSLEELVAEFTSAFLCAECQIDNTMEASTAYIQGWLKVLKNDRQMVLTAASQAQKATDYILGKTWDGAE